MQIQDYFINGDVKTAIEYMKKHQEFKDILPAYIAIFEKCEYLTYDIPEFLNEILLTYQVYYRDIFYCGMKKEEADNKLIEQLKKLLNKPDISEIELENKLVLIFEEYGYHALFGSTQGYYGPYIWKETVPTRYNVELPNGSAMYTVNILRGFIFCSWMRYLTFGRFGTNGWASIDGTINCIEDGYDFESEKFTISLLKHEAQHTVDMKQYPGIKEDELEYRAKLVELIYSNDISLLNKFISVADENKVNDGHAIASVRIKKEFNGIDQSNIYEIKKYALNLFYQHNQEMSHKYLDLK